MYFKFKIVGLISVIPLLSGCGSALVAIYNSIDGLIPRPIEQSPYSYELTITDLRSQQNDVRTISCEKYYHTSAGGMGNAWRWRYKEDIPSFQLVFEGKRVAELTYPSCKNLHYWDNPRIRESFDTLGFRFANREHIYLKSYNGKLAHIVSVNSQKIVMFELPINIAWRRIERE